jgi:large subunit ribosomal protein L24
MRIKKGDTVKILSGKDSGKTGKVLKVDAKSMKAIVENLNLVTKHVKPKRSNEKGQRVQVPSSLDVSNLILVCPKCGKTTRVGIKLGKDKKFRICKKCKEEISAL